ncbi:acyltransferase [Polynucleobacter sp. MWH-UH19D]|uniref:acyltransferase family protein n=1 Tax=Polynucleobacter sp. MWH-UH19D TaxID=1855610 RepID=UPI003364CC84
MKYRADIDGLRAVAIISVIGFHAYPNLLKGGFTGVDIFFVISGYLITTIILNELESGDFKLKEFYIRRIRRIFPSLLLVLLSSLMFGWFALFADEYKQLGKHIFGGSTFISNFIYWKESGYFDDIAEKKPLLHLWSLAIEEQYYLVWPLLILIFWIKKIKLAVIILALIFASFIFNILTAKVNITAAFFLPHTRFWELMVGSMVAYSMLYASQYARYLSLWKKYLLSIIHENLFGANLSKYYIELPSIIGGILIIGSIFLITKEFKFPGWWATLPIMGATFVIVSSQDAWINRVILSHKFMVWLGLISFPLYLWHWPILSFARILEGKELSAWTSSFCIFLSLICATITYYFIEKPIRFAENKYKVLMLMALMIVIGVSGYIVSKENGYDFRIQSREIILKQFDWDTLYNKSEECQKKFPGGDYCNISNSNSPPNVAIIGDSHANHFYWGLSEYYKAKNKNLINMGVGGCPPFLGISMSGPSTSPNCYSRMLPIFNYVLNNKSIDTVYIAFWHNAYFDKRLIYTDNMGSIWGNDNYEYVFKAFERTLMKLRSHGKRVILIYDLPDMKEGIKDCFLKRPIVPTKICTLDESIFIDDYSQYDRLIKDLVIKHNLEIFDARKYINGNFPVDKYGVPMYRDYSHLSINGSLFFADKYWQ